MESIYIHIPFCKSICSYCDFCKMFHNEKLINKYLESLEVEINNNYKNEKLKTIYIGGGTPSCLSIEQLKKLFSITNKLNIYNNYEFTIESNINDINKSFLELCKNNKVNRISIGIETINDKFYKLLNRYNNKEDIINKIILCKKYFNNINIDLMYGFPKETISDLKKDLDFITSLNIPHISIYSLILEENTVLYINKTKPISEDLESNMYYYIINYLKEKEYIHYEISNFSKEEYYSKHNLCYWNNSNYYGFGLGASGYINDIRYTNTRSINKYLKHEFISYKETINNKTKMEEELICGLRKIDGVSLNGFKEKYLIELKDVFNIDLLLEKGLLKEKNGYIFIPEEKLYISNSILTNFIIE